jgi:hypothetical protein
VSTVAADVAHPGALATPGAARYDAAMAGVLLVFQAGAYLDLWAHVHRPDLETFFTPWHAVLYSGFFAAAALTVAPLVRRPRGVAWHRALPAGYDLSVVGVLVFFLGGVLDMLWHTIFGIEVDIEALLSPSHLVLAVGGALMFTGPLRAAWRRPGATMSWSAVLSVCLLLSAFSFWTQYMHLVGRPWFGGGYRPAQAQLPLLAPDQLYRNAQNPAAFVVQALGVASVVLQAAILAGLVLLVVRRWESRLPAGAFTLVFALNALMLGLARDQVSLLPAATAAGLATDALMRWLSPSVDRPAGFRVFAFAVPATYTACIVAATALIQGLWWSVSLWSGVVVLAGGAGWLVSWLVAPPAVPETAQRR